MKTTVKLSDTYNGSEVFVVNIETKRRGENSGTWVKSYGVTVHYEPFPYIYHRGIYNMVTGKTIFVKSVKEIVLNAIKNNTFVKATYYKNHKTN